MGIDTTMEEEELLQEVEQAQPDYSDYNATSYNNSLQHSSPVVSLYNLLNEGSTSKKSGRFLCEICHTSFKYSKPFKIHMKNKHPTYILPNLGIKSEYPNQGIFEDDDDDSQGVKKSGEFQCQICFKSFKYLKPYLHHMNTHPEAAQEPIPYQPIEQEEEKEEDSENNGEDFSDEDFNINGSKTQKTCNICNKTFSYSKSYYRHMKKKHKEKKSEILNISRKSIARSTLTEAILAGSSFDHKKPGRPRIHPVKQQLYERPGRPRIYPPKEQTIKHDRPGRPRLYPPKEKLYGKPGRPRIHEVKVKKYAKAGRPRRNPVEMHIEDNKAIEEDPIDIIDDEGAEENDEEEDIDEYESESGGFVDPNFREVDLKQVLGKSSKILEQVDLTDSPVKKKRRRSRSSSIEMVDEFDIFNN